MKRNLLSVALSFLSILFFCSGLRAQARPPHVVPSPLGYSTPTGMPYPSYRPMPPMASYMNGLSPRRFFYRSPISDTSARLTFGAKLNILTGLSQFPRSLQERKLKKVMRDLDSDSRVAWYFSLRGSASTLILFPELLKDLEKRFVFFDSKKDNSLPHQVLRRTFFRNSFQNALWRDQYSPLTPRAISPYQNFAEILAYGVELHLKPSFGSEILGQGVLGKVYPILGQTGEWVQIMTKGKTPVFVSKSVIKIIKPEVLSLKTNKKMEMN